MKANKMKWLTGPVLLASILACTGATEAAASSLNQSGTVTVEGSGTTDPVDPEKPSEPSDPGPGPSTSGSLRIDYVSSLDFGRAVIKDKDRNYPALAQLFKGDTEARGSYIQITDERSGAYGWTIQVKQNYQFKNDVIQESKEQELTGAVLSLDKGWANTMGNSGAPAVTRDTIAINSIGQAYEIARAESGSGLGTWTVEFGASQTNTSNQGNTLTPLYDEAGEPVINETYNKQAYSNSAITLSVPDTTKIYPVQYQTELTWILAELP